jgi:hypothetical protein
VPNAAAAEGETPLSVVLTDLIPSTQNGFEDITDASNIILIGFECGVH